jgi:peptide deformylase
MKKILQKEEKVLREIAKEVPLEEIKTPKIQNLINDMFESLAGEEDGVALAAPQIGESLRVFIITPKIFGKPEEEHLVFINPKIIKKSKDNKKMDEGCLSCRWFYGTTKRASRVEIEAYNENGEKFTMIGTKLIAQIFQHETDHFDGVLFIDHAINLKEMEEGYE